MRSRTSGVVLCAVLVAALAVVALQPVGSSWATYADADAIYAGNSLNILAGERTSYFDHPGLPLQELLAVTFGADYAVERVTDETRSLRGYANASLLDLDRTRALYRGWGILFYLAGAALSVFVATRLFRHWSFGLAGGLFWLGAPGIAVMAIQYRADVPLVVLTLGIGYLIARGAEERSPRWLAWAAFLLGLAAMIKVHAVGLAVPLLAAAVLRRPGDDWRRELLGLARRFVVRRRVALLAGGAVWIGLAAFLNWQARPFGPAPSQRTLVAELLVAYGLYWLGVAAVGRLRAPATLRRVFDPFLAALAGLLGVGLAVPATLAIGDWFIALQQSKVALTGGGVNRGVTPFSGALGDLSRYPLRESALVFALAAVAGVVAMSRRDRRPAFWLLGAGVMAAMAAARFGTPHYFAPAYVLAVPAALSLFRRPEGGRAAFAVWPVVALLAGSTLVHSATDDPDGWTCSARVAQRAAQLVNPGEVVLTDLAVPEPDSRFFLFVEGYTTRVPPYPYRFLPRGAEAAARARGLEPRYYAGESVGAPASARPLFRDGSCVVAELAPA